MKAKKLKKKLKRMQLELDHMKVLVTNVAEKLGIGREQFMEMVEKSHEIAKTFNEPSLRHVAVSSIEELREVLSDVPEEILEQIIQQAREAFDGDDEAQAIIDRVEASNVH